MSEYSSLKATINANVKTNGNQEITGSIMNSVLNAMVDSLGAGYQFMGVATPTNPGSAQTPDYKCFYLATTPGTYTHLGGLVVADGEVALLKYDSSWTKEVTGIASADKLNQLGQYIQNQEYIIAYLDKEKKLLFGVRSDGDFVFGSGVPTQVQNYITQLLQSKVDKENGKGLSSNDFTDSIKEVVELLSLVEDNNNLEIEYDKDGKVLKLLDKQGKEHIFTDSEYLGDVVIRKKLEVGKDGANSVKESSAKNATSINAFNPFDYYYPRLFNITFHGTADARPLVICQITDIHGYASYYKRIIDFLNLYEGLYDDVIITGDIVESHFADSIDFLNQWNKIPLLVIGNHDAWEANSLPIVIVPAIDDYNKFIAPFVNQWGVVQPSDASEGKCYYYKDYPQSKIRLIVTDCMHDSQDQIDFVTDALVDAKTKDLSVIISQHYAAGEGTPCDVPFDTLDKIGYEYNPSYLNAVDNFINNGGKFICWMCGHHHQDLFGYVDGHPNQLQICTDCACDRNTSDTARIPATKSQDSFTFYSFDTSLGVFTMMRVGATFDRHLQNKDSLIWDYINKKEIH